MAAVVGGLDHLRGHDEIVFGIDGHLDMVADEVPVGTFHFPAVGVGQGNFVLAALLEIPEQFVVAALVFFELGDLVLQRLAAGGGGDALGLGVLAVEFTQIFVDAGFDFLEQFAQLLLGCSGGGGCSPL